MDQTPAAATYVTEYPSTAAVQTLPAFPAAQTAVMTQSVPMVQVVPATQSAATPAYFAPATSVPMVAANGSYYSPGTAVSPAAPVSPAAQPTMMPAPQVMQQAPVTVQNGSVVDQMLQEAGQGPVYSASACPNGCYYPQNGGVPNGSCFTQGGYGQNNWVGQGAPGQNCAPINGGYWQANQFGGGGYNGECADGCQQSPWFASLDVIFMGRTNANGFYTSYETNNNPNQLMTTEHNMEWQPGGELRFGRRFGCNTWAVEGVYWALADFSDDQCVSNANTVSTPLNVDGIQFCYPNGTWANGTAIFDNACEHLIHRQDEVQNAEVNFICAAMGCPCQCGWTVNWAVGFRFFHFTDDLSFTAINDNPALYCNSATLEDRVENNLFGCQVGFDLGYNITCCWDLFLNTKFGIYDNHMDGTFSAYSGCTNASPTPASGVTGCYPVSACKDAAAFLGEIRIGTHYNFSRCFGAEIGYRVVAVSGIALADNQFPQYVCDIPSLQNIKSNGDLVLHGGFAGLTFNW
jgi:hypothetical protein